MSRISIVIATLNCESLIVDCIASIIKCCGEDVELIIQDGLSTDKTLNILESYSIKYVSELDIGIYDAFNKALKRVTGEWVIFMGADDRLLINPKVIIGGVGAVNSIIYGNVINADTAHLYDGKFTRLKLARRNICQQAIIYPAEIFKTRIFDLKYKYLSDYDFNLKLCGAGYKFTYINKCWMVYGNSGLSKAGDGVFESEKLHKVNTELGSAVFLMYVIGRNVMSKFNSLKSIFWKF